MSRALLEADVVDAALISPWRRDGDALERAYTAKSARAALQLIQRIGDLAEGANHHPDLTWVYRSLTIRLNTHDAGGITKLDLHLAACIEDVLRERE